MLESLTIIDRSECATSFFFLSLNSTGQQVYPTTISTDSNSVERLKERLLHTQSELAGSKQEYEEFKELTK